MWFWNDFVLWLEGFSAWVRSLFAFFGLCLLLVVFTGCVGKTLTAEQQAAATAKQMTWVDKAVETAQKHGLAYQIEVSTTGRPSVGQSLDFYLDSGLRAKVNMFGNAANMPKDE